MTKQRYHYQINIREREDGRYFVRQTTAIIADRSTSYDETIVIREQLFDDYEKAIIWLRRIIQDNQGHD